MASSSRCACHPPPVVEVAHAGDVAAERLVLFVRVFPPVRTIGNEFAGRVLNPPLLGVESFG
jgi:hypothetical protein